MTDVKAVVEDAANQAEKYFETTNNIFGMFAVTIGLGCFSAENTQFYAWLTAFFLVIAWNSSFRNYKRRLEMLKVIKHYKMNFAYIVKRCYVAFIGWGFLGAIAVGLLDKNGVTFF